MKLLLLAAAGFLLASQSAHAESRYEISKVISAIYSTPKDLVLLTPHRGLWESVPENTTLAFDRAMSANFETVEIDVRLSGDGTPWLMHDFNLDRLTDAHGPLASYKDSTLSTVHVRDRHGIVTSTTMIRLEDFLEYYRLYLERVSRSTLRGAVLVIDLKSPPGGDPHFKTVSAYEALKISWKLLKDTEKRASMLFSDAVIFKLKAKEIPSPATLFNDLKIKPEDNFHFMPVMHPDDASNGNRVLDEYEKLSVAIGFEPVMEYYGQPQAMEWIKRLQDQGRTIPGFPGWNDYPEGVSFSSGICCLNRNTDPNDTSKPLDYSGSFEYQLQIGANWLTADTVEFLDEYLKAQHRRNLEQLR